MALFTDGSISDSEDLRAYESGILDVASIEGIELDAKFRLATRDLGIEISQVFEDEHLDIGLESVVVTPALARWHTLRTLSLTYRDAYFVQLNDRYEAKWHEYERDAIVAGNALLELGIGVTTDAVPRAATPTLDAINGGVQTQHDYFVQIAWISPQGTLGGRSSLTTATVDAGKLLRVAPGQAPANASGWLVWAGTDPEALARQVQAPVSVSVKWTMPVDGLKSSPIDAPYEIQPSYLVRKRQLWRRG